MIVEELLEEDYPLIVGPSLSERSKIELRNLTFETAGILSNAGKDICIMTDHPVIPLQYLPICAGLAVKYGMKQEKSTRGDNYKSSKSFRNRRQSWFYRSWKRCRYSDLGRKPTRNPK